MKRMLKGFFSLVLLASTVAALRGVDSDDTTACFGNPFFYPRSQSENAARDMVGWQTHINRYDMDCFYAAFAITPEYTRSFRPNNIATFLFGNDLVQVTNPNDTDDTISALKISGSAVTGRAATDWLADYFGLGDQFSSTVSFKPRISNFLVDFALYMGFDEWCPGLFFRIHAPVVATRWSLNAEESNINIPNTNGYYAGYMSNDVITTGLPTSWIQYMQGGVTFGDMSDPMKYGLLPGKANASDPDDAGKKTLKKTRLSDIQAELGWNFWSCEDYNVGIGIRGAAPTGNRPEAVYLFEPIVGNGHFWELGAGINTMAVLWRGCDEDKFFAVYADANVTHLFKTKQTRSFDFVNKPNSRYALVEEFTSTVGNLLQGNPTANIARPVPTPPAGGSVSATAQYNGKLHPAINITTMDVDVSVGVQGDFALKFSYYSCGLELDLGYNLWGRTGEKFKLKNDPIGTNKYALKGDAFIYGFDRGDQPATGANLGAVALSASESKSDIHGGTNFTTANGINGFFNAGVDTPLFAYGTAQNPALQANVDALQNDPTTLTPGQTRSSFAGPTFLTIADVNLAKTPSALSNKIFAHLGYSWLDCEDWVPFLGIGGEAEFGSKNSNSNNNANNNGNGCYAALSQWGVWVKGGIAFN